MPDTPSSSQPGRSDPTRSGGADPAPQGGVVSQGGILPPAGTAAAGAARSGRPGAPRHPADIELVVAPDGDNDHAAHHAAYRATEADWTGELPWQEEPQPPRAARSSRRRRLVLGAALAVGLLGAAGIGSIGWRIADQKDATLETPQQVAGLVRDDSARARETAEYLRTGFAADIDLKDSIGAVYTDPADENRSVLVFGGTALLWQPEQDLGRLFDLVADDGESVEGLRELPPGELGGVLKCGTTPTDEGDIAVCGWADHGSVVLAMFPGRQVDESATLLRQIRSEIQTRG